MVILEWLIISRIIVIKEFVLGKCFMLPSKFCEFLSDVFPLLRSYLGGLVICNKVRSVSLNLQSFTDKRTYRRQRGDTTSDTGEKFVQFIQGKIIIVIFIVSLEKLANIVQMGRGHRNLRKR